MKKRKVREQIVAALACSHNCIGHINKVKLRRARSVVGLVTTLGGYIVPVFSEPLRPIQRVRPDQNLRLNCRGFGGLNFL